MASSVDKTPYMMRIHLQRVVPWCRGAFFFSAREMEAMQGGAEGELGGRISSCVKTLYPWWTSK